MLLDKTRFSIAQFLEEHFAIFKREVMALNEEDFTLWTDLYACTKPWMCVPLISTAPPANIEVDWERQERLMPESVPSPLMWDPSNGLPGGRIADCNTLESRIQRDFSAV
jgi:hypothetical protein